MEVLMLLAFSLFINVFTELVKVLRFFITCIVFLHSDKTSQYVVKNTNVAKQRKGKENIHNNFYKFLYLNYKLIYILNIKVKVNII